MRYTHSAHGVCLGEDEVTSDSVVLVWVSVCPPNPYVEILISRVMV